MVQRRALLALVLTTTLAAGLPATARGAADLPRARADHEPGSEKLGLLKQTIRLADGRRAQVFTKDRHRVFLRNTAPDGTTFGKPRLIHRAAGECHQILLATNSGTLAVVLRCYREGTDFTADPWADDSRLLVSTDLKTWKKTKDFLPLATVVVSPDGKRVLVSGLPLVFWQRGVGFSREILPENELTETTGDYVITDDGALTAVIAPEGDESDESECRVDLWLRRPGASEFVRTYRSPESFYDGDQTCPYWYRVRLSARGVLQLFPENYPDLLFKFKRNAAGEWVPA